jgi:hypothetical protein
MNIKRCERGIGEEGKGEGLSVKLILFTHHASLFTLYYHRKIYRWKYFYIWRTIL